MGRRGPAHADHPDPAPDRGLTGLTALPPPPPAAPDPPRVGWGLPDAAAGYVAGLFGAGLVGGLWAAVSGTGEEVTLGAVVAGLLGLWLGYLTTCAVVTRLKGTGSLADDFGLARPRLVDVAVGVAAGLASSVVLVRAVYEALFALRVLERSDLDRLDDPARRLTDLVQGPNAVVLFLMVGVGAPLVEELFFRGLLQRALVRRLGAGWGIPVGAVLFGAAHLQALQFPALAAFGLVLGLLAHRTGRLAPGIAAHMAFNCLTLVSLLLADPAGDPAASRSRPPAPMEERGPGGAPALEETAMTCPVCRDRKLVEIDLSVGGRPVTLHSCSRCDTRWWDQEGAPIELRTVLDMATPRP